ncbi:hypothetical protein BSQ39_03840 [Loigolactobacillus backii]|uniref:acyl-CoA thioesterase n=1 Tax=Loigolactobacillus backii TaxID=375175 RepID=UPI000C1CAC87|nr:hotdog domain-containing protein [Loigolactobacillus backii]PIO82770.1 hypothetical protein BSQ39_03840 [Loigolactobacillus backii]
MKQQIKTCAASTALQAHHILYQDLNSLQTLHGGHLMALVDNVASISALRFANTAVMTATVDHFEFKQAFQVGQIVTVQTYVSGAGNRSLEIFAKVIGEDALSGERYLGATAFLTFVALDKQAVLPTLRPESREEKLVCAAYEQRRAANLKAQQESSELAQQLDLSVK